MCIIAVKNSGPITEQQWGWLRCCFNNNPDGAGFMYQANGGVRIVKGLMNYDAFETTVQEHGCDVLGLVVFHFRQATHGKVSAENTHPFPLSADYAELGKVDVVATTGIVHNGVLPVASDAEHSDTMNFVRTYLSPFRRLTLRVLNLVALTGDKFVVLDAKSVYTIGKFEKEGDWAFSNGSYKQLLPVRPNFYDPEWWEAKDSLPYGGGGLGAGFCDNCGWEFKGGSKIHAEALDRAPNVTVCERCMADSFEEVGDDDAAWYAEGVYLVGDRFGTFRR